MNGRSADGHAPSAMPLVLLGALGGAAVGWFAFDPDRAFYRPHEFSEETFDADP